MSLLNNNAPKINSLLDLAMPLPAADGLINRAPINALLDMATFAPSGPRPGLINGSPRTEE